MQQTHHSRDTAEQVEAEGNVDQHQRGSDQHAENGVAHQRCTGHRAHIAGRSVVGVHIGVFFQKNAFQAVLQVLHLVLAGQSGNADLHGSSVGAYGGHHEFLDAPSLQRLFHIGLVVGGAHIVLQIQTARKVNTIVDAMAGQAHDGGDQHDRDGNAEANFCTILNFHLTSPPSRFRPQRALHSPHTGRDWARCEPRRSAGSG